MADDNPMGRPRGAHRNASETEILLQNPFELDATSYERWIDAWTYCYFSGAPQHDARPPSG
jgi:hypothetical protein